MCRPLMHFKHGIEREHLMPNGTCLIPGAASTTENPPSDESYSELFHQLYQCLFLMRCPHVTYLSLIGKFWKTHLNIFPKFEFLENSSNFYSKSRFPGHLNLCWKTHPYLISCVDEFSRNCSQQILYIRIFDSEFQKL